MSAIGFRPKEIALLTDGGQPEVIPPEVQPYIGQHVTVTTIVLQDHVFLYYIVQAEDGTRLRAKPFALEKLGPRKPPLKLIHSRK